MLCFARPIFERLRSCGVRHWLLFDALWLAYRAPEQLSRADLNIDIGVDASDFAACRDMLLAYSPSPDEVPNGRRADPNVVSLTRADGQRVRLWRTERRGVARVIVCAPEQFGYEFHFCGAEELTVAGHPVTVPRYAPPTP